MLHEILFVLLISVNFTDAPVLGLRHVFVVTSELGNIILARDK